MKLLTILLAPIVAVGMASSALARDYKDLVAEGYRRVSLDGPYACPTKEETADYPFEVIKMIVLIERLFYEINQDFNCRSGFGRHSGDGAHPQGIRSRWRRCRPFRQWPCWWVCRPWLGTSRRSALCTALFAQRSLLVR